MMPHIIAHRVVTFAVLAALAFVAAACSDGSTSWQGWIEADTIFVAPDEGGRLVSLSVREGDEIKAGDQVFALDDELQKADLNQAKATLENARLAFERAQQLNKTGSGTQRDYDAAQSAFRVAQAQATSAETRLARRTVRSPVTGRVQQVYARTGEMASAQKPVVAILPPGNIKARFYVRESEVATIKIDDMVKLTCDGCASDIQARITYKSQNAEYTPPVIYSLDERGKLVFLVQARPDRADGLHVGQPIQVRKAAAP